MHFVCMLDCHKETRPKPIFSPFRYIASPDQKLNRNYLGPASIEDIAKYESFKCNLVWHLLKKKTLQQNPESEYRYLSKYMDPLCDDFSLTMH